MKVANPSYHKLLSLMAIFSTIRHPIPGIGVSPSTCTIYLKSKDDVVMPPRTCRVVIIFSLIDADKNDHVVVVGVVGHAMMSTPQPKNKTGDTSWK